MGLITRCPACGTMFKVVPDQLRISEGWVRCGHCADIFDAQAHMVREGDLQPVRSSETAPGSSAAAESPSAPTATPTAAPTASPMPERNASPAEEDAPPASTFLREEYQGYEEPADREGHDDFISTLTTEVRESQFMPSLDSRQFEEEARALREDPRDEPFELRFRGADSLEGGHDEAPAITSRPVPLETEPDLEALSFMRKARDRAFWRSGAVRAVLAVCAVLLVALLAGQVAVDRRDLLAARHPAWRPWLAAACAPLGCHVGPPRQIDAIAIESSTFTNLRPDTYRLNVTLRNQSPVDVAMPALELTLTDAQEQPVARKVLAATEIAPRTPAIAANAAWSTTVGFAVTADKLPGRVAGYRVLAFYP